MNVVLIYEKEKFNNLKIDEKIKLICCKINLINFDEDISLDKLFYEDSEFKIKLELVRQGYFLDKLINDKDEIIREAVAKQGYGLDKLVNDESIFVRKEIVRQGYYLDKFLDNIDNEAETVILEVAKQGYRLDKLINYIDESIMLVPILYNQNYGLNNIDSLYNSNLINLLLKNSDLLNKDISSMYPSM